MFTRQEFGNRMLGYLECRNSQELAGPLRGAVYVNMVGSGRSFHAVAVAAGRFNARRAAKTLVFRQPQHGEHSGPSISEMKAIFRLYDTNNSGSLDLGEVTSLLDDLDMLKTQRRKSAFCKQMLHEHDADADGALSFDEFQRLWPKVCRMQAVRLLNLDLPSEATKQGRRLRELMAAPATAVSISSLWQTAHEPTPAQSLLNAQFLHRELIVRRAGLLRMLTSLPSGLATHPRVLEIGELYRRLLAQLLNTSTPRDAETEWVFEHRLRTTFLTHTQVPAAIGAALHDLSNGARSPPTTEEQREIDSRLDAFFSSRLGLRFLAHHYLSSKVTREGWSGILHSKCSPVTVCRTAAADVRRWAKARFGVSPEVSVVGDEKLTFTFVPAHILFVVTELLENAAEASIRKHAPQLAAAADAANADAAYSDAAHAAQAHANATGVAAPTGATAADAAAAADAAQSLETALEPCGRAATASGAARPALSPSELTVPLPPIRVVVAASDHSITIKVEDVGGGFGRSKLGAVWSYAGSRRLRAGHGGLGLPLSRLYARYFGGTLHVAPLEGYGTDAYVTLNRLEGANQETLYFIKEDQTEEEELEQRACRSEPPSSLLEEPGMLHDGLFDAQARRGSSSKSTGASDT